MNAFVARQAILDRDRQVVAYELLFRSSGLSKSFDGVDGNQATSHVIANSLFAIGLEKLLAGKLAFINFTRELLVSDSPRVLSPKSTVVEILETVHPDDEVLQACRRLKEKGYLIALDDFVSGGDLDALTALADYIKVDFRGTKPSEQAAIARRYGARGVKMLAEKVETMEEFQRAQDLGYDYFQGYFLARPTIVEGKQLPAFRMHYQRLLAAIHNPVFEWREVEGIVKHELSLVYKLFQYVNSARFARRNEVESIRQALVILGQDEIRRWSWLAILSGMGQDKPRELVITAMIRARFCELIGPDAGLSGQEQNLFLLGIFSLIDAITDRTLEDALAVICLDAEVSAVLRGVSGPNDRMAMVYNLVRAYEAGDWAGVSVASKRLSLPEDVVPARYLESVQWAEEIFLDPAAGPPQSEELVPG